MNFYDLGEALRREMQHRLAAGRLTQSQLAELTGFRQAHISNFLSGRRALSLEGLDRLLSSQQLDVRELLPGKLNLHAAEDDSSAQTVPVVSARRLISARKLDNASEFTSIVPPGNPARPSAERLPWDRFAAIRITAAHAIGVSAVLPQHSIASVDRHDTAPPASGKVSASFFAVAVAGRLLFRRVERHKKLLLLRPQEASQPATLLTDHQIGAIVGRVCWIAQPA